MRNMIFFTEHIIIKDSVKDGLRLKITKNEMSDRLFVEFSNENGSLVLQKNFQNTVVGRQALDKFQTTIKSLKDLKKYFGLNKRSKK